MNQGWRSQCRKCGTWLAPTNVREMDVKPPKPKPPRRGTVAYWERERAHAAKMADGWATKAVAAVKRMREWQQAEKRFSVRIALGPQPLRPKKPKAVRRAIALGKKEAS